MKKSHIITTLCLSIFSLFNSCNWQLDKTEIEWECGCDLVDERDGQEYNTVWIDVNGGNDLSLAGQCWMADNLRYKMSSSSTVIIGDCEHATESSELYTLEEAKEACPIGWKLASDGDWINLEYAIKLNPEQIHCYSRAILNSPDIVSNCDPSIYNPNNPPRGIVDPAQIGPRDRLDNLSFNLSFPGFYNHVSPEELMDCGKLFIWTSTEFHDDNYAYTRLFYRNLNGIDRWLKNPALKHCVRCIKN